ncbi:MAG: DUF4919 domain-containing protein [Cytophagaceae bacterium]|nr:DUF4919 domain-containing protein [Cytophagaceae bacterium]
MTKLIVRVCYLLLLPLSLAQAQINTDSIAQTTSSSAGRSNYKQLVEKLKQSDSTLQRTDFLTLYYGSVKQPSYKLDLIDSLEQNIKEHNLLQEFIQAYELADTLLAFHPVSITAYFEKSFSCYALKRPDEEFINKQKYRLFIKCVLSSGNGFEATPFVVVSYNDAIEVLKYLQIKYKTIEEKDNNSIVAVLNKKRQGSDQLYFRLPVLHP